MDLQDDVNIVSSIRSTNDEIKTSLNNIISSLIRDVSVNIRLHLGPSSCNLFLPLIGILRCSGDVGVVMAAVKCVTALCSSSSDDDNCSVIKCHLAKLNCVEILLSLLNHPIHADKLSLHDGMGGWEWLPVQEHITIALRKLTHHSEYNQASFIKHGGVGKIVKLCHMELKHDPSSYPPGMIQELRDNVMDRILIAAVLPIPKGEKAKLKQSLPLLSLLDDNVDYPMYYVDLSDDNGRWITDSLISKGLAMADEELFPILDSVSWIGAKCTHVSDNGIIWLQYSINRCSERLVNMHEALNGLNSSSSSLGSPPALSLGSVYAVYDGGAWHRGWLLREPDDNGNHTFFCMDYGFCITAPIMHVLPLPSACRGIPPQAVPCQLVGICPPPKSFIILENVAGILCNLSFDNESHRIDIKASKGLQFLLQSLSIRDMRVKESSLDALVNITHSEDLCQLLCKMGTIQILIELVISNLNISYSIIDKCIGIIMNMLINDTSSTCIDMLDVYRGYDKLKGLTDDDDNVARLINKLLLAIDGLKNGLKPIKKINQILKCEPFPSTVYS